MTAKKNSLKLVPFGTKHFWNNGDSYDARSMLEYTWGKPGEQASEGYGQYATPIEWVPNEPFVATLTIRELERGRSAARFWFTDEEGTWYPFFGQGLVDMLSAVNLEHGTVTATWIAVKRGANYGIELLPTED